MVTAAYIAAIILFILTLGGLSHQESARRGNVFGMLGMAIAVLATVFGPEADIRSPWLFALIAVMMITGGTAGLVLARRVQMTQMPELVAILHSLVGLAAVLVGYVNLMDDTQFAQQSEKTIHSLEIYIGVLIGAVTFSGSVAAFGKLSGRLNSAPLLLPARHWLNLGLLLLAVVTGWAFVNAADQGGWWAWITLLFMTTLALGYGLHMVLAIGGADMPVVVSMLNSYSGWAASATGFMLGNDLLIVVGALVGSSGAILSYIMCRAMNRRFLSVIAGGFGVQAAGPAPARDDGAQQVQDIEAPAFAELLLAARDVVIIPGYGMAVAQAQHAVYELSRSLGAQGVRVRFAIHPVAGRMPGHMNVLLAEARVPYDVVFEMDEINDDFPQTDVAMVIGANDTVNPAALEDPDSPIAGMPVLHCWQSRVCVVLKRSMATGYAGVQNPLFFRDNTRMYFGDAKGSLDAVLQQLSQGTGVS